jgi:hypothetical protein
MNRGNQGREIFRDDEDRQLFLKTLDEACGKTGWAVHAYVLMGNHYHALLGNPGGEPGRRDEVISGDVHAAVQFAASGVRPSFSGTLQGAGDRRRSRRVFSDG